MWVRADPAFKVPWMVWGGQVDRMAAREVSKANADRPGEGQVEVKEGCLEEVFSVC